MGAVACVGVSFDATSPVILGEAALCAMGDSCPACSSLPGEHCSDCMAIGKVGSALKLAPVYCDTWYQTVPKSNNLFPTEWVRYINAQNVLDKVVRPDRRLSSVLSTRCFASRS